MRPVITSPDNPLIRDLQKLQTKAALRAERGVFVVEGPKQVAEAVAEGLVLRLLVITSAQRIKAAALLRLAAERGISVQEISEAAFKKISDTQTPQGVLAVIERPKASEDILAKGNLFLLLECIQDPGNLGTIIRSAEGAGVDAVLLSEGCADVYAPKTVRSTMGSLYRVPILTGVEPNKMIRYLQKRGVQVCAAALTAESCSFTELSYRKPTAFVIGNEAKGLSEATINAADQAVILPMAGKLESFNAGVAATLLAYFAGLEQGKIS
ncbi:MAG: RNA methyltransferase [Lachnospiraceae bacterium]|nr:RNA methyltransferase [Lachnospiraceae bacterium]MDY5742558.1 RNA methyltransferase [Lachnospiraceae bacterium]